MAKRIWSEEDLKEIIKLYTEDGKTLKEIGLLFKTKGDTISKLLKREGVQIKRRGASVNRRLIENYFSVIDTEAKAYFLGLILADGNISPDPGNKRSPSLRIELTESDKEILEKLREELRVDSPLRYDKRADRKNGTYAFQVRSKVIAKDLSRFNITPNKTYEMQEIDLTSVPKDLIPHFLRGFVDGDGSIYYSLNMWHLSITGKQESLIAQIKSLCYDLIDEPDQGAITDYKGIRKHTWNGLKAIKLIDALYSNSNFFIERKKELANKAIQVEDIV